MRIAGRYEVIKKLGEGGMGVVYLVADTANNRRHVALKTLKSAGRTQDALEHFKYEFSLMAGLRHPNIEEVYDFGQIPETTDCFFTCEFVDGPNLMVALEKAPQAELTEIVVQICRGLQFLHSRGIAHFDVKPDNLVLKSSGSAHLVKIIDLGLAQRGRGGSGPGTAVPSITCPPRSPRASPPMDAPTCIPWESLFSRS
jgi:serine/threonine protein kinase